VPFERGVVLVADHVSIAILTIDSRTRDQLGFGFEAVERAVDIAVVGPGVIALEPVLAGEDADICLLADLAACV
jgi:hypothetical protein